MDDEFFFDSFQEDRPIDDKLFEKAYMGEHPNIQPVDMPRKPLSPLERRFYEYTKERPDYNLPSACRALKITKEQYYNIKKSLKQKNWPVQGVIDWIKEI